jgi:hypothetical protein
MISTCSYLESEETYNSSQYATTTPKIFRVNSMAMNWPRPVCGTLSVAQTGTIALRMPVPNPLIKRAREPCQHFIYQGVCATYQKSSRYDFEQSTEDLLPEYPKQRQER